MNQNIPYIIEGRLGSEPKVLESKNTGEDFCVLRLARTNTVFNETTKSYEQVDPDWFDVKVFGTLADRSMSLKTGDLVTAYCAVKPFKVETKEGVSIGTYSFIAKDIKKSELLPKASMVSKLASGHSVESVFGGQDEI